METNFQDTSKDLPVDKNSIKADRAKRMFDEITKTEPELLHLISEGASETDDLFLFTVIANAKDKNLKSNLLDIYVEDELEEKDYFGAVFGLAVAKASELSIPKYDEKFVHAQYQEALKSGEIRQAWGISLLMESDDVNKTIVSEMRKDWNVKENKAFEKIQDEATLAELFGHVTNNLKRFGEMFAVSIVEAKAMSMPWIYEVGEAGDKLIADVLDKMGYKFERPNNKVDILRKIESSARK